MKKHNKILRTCLTLAIIGTTFAPIASAVNHSKPCAGQKRPSSAASARAGKKIRISEYPNPESFDIYRIKEQQTRQQATALSTEHSTYLEKKPEILQRYIRTQIRLQAKNSVYYQLDKVDISGLSKEDRVYLCGMINESGDHLFQNLSITGVPPKRIFDYVCCFNYLKNCIDHAIVYEPTYRWYEVLKKPFEIVLKEESELALKKLLSNLTSRLTKPVDSEDCYNENYQKILDELAPHYVPFPMYR